MGDALAVERAHLVDAGGDFLDGSMRSAIGQGGYGNARQALHDENVGIERLAFRRERQVAPVVLEEGKVGTGRYLNLRPLFVA